MLKWHDEVVANGAISAKMKTFEGDQRSRGAKWSMVHNKWDKPEMRREIEKAAAQEHAAGLMRIDKESRKHGKYVQMKRKLISKYKARRARARKCSAKWFVHTARYRMLTDHPGQAFKGSDGWLRRMFRRFSLVRRKKTNVKNKTWEETKPVLQRYFRAFRRRLRDSEWKRLQASAAAADTAPAAAVEPVPR